MKKPHIDSIMSKIQSALDELHALSDGNRNSCYKTAFFDLLSVQKMLEDGKRHEIVSKTKKDVTHGN